MKFGIFALCCLVASAAAVSVKYDTSYEIPKTVNQEFINLILRHISQPLIIDEYRQFIEKPILEPTRYVSPEIFQSKIYRFFDLYQHGLILPRGRVGTLFDQKFLEQTGLLFNIFYYSVDYPTLFENIIWARENVNELMFVHALHLAVFHRPDIKDIVLPPLYEIIPQHFFTYDVLQKGIDYRLAGLDTLNKTFTVYTDYTSRFYLDKFDEQRLAYFTEDIGLNSFYYYFYMRYPFFLGGRYNAVDMKVFGFDKEPVGELWFYLHQQLLARYYLERYSNDLGDILDITWTKGIKTGYWPMLRYKNGMEFSYRSDYYGIENMDTDFLDIVYDWEERIRSMIDSGYITLEDKKYYIYDPQFLDILGNLMLGNVEQTRFYRYVLVFYHLLAGGRGTVKMDSYFYAPSALEHFETVLRDPVFYQMYKRVIRFYLQYKDQLPTYTTRDLFVPVKIMDVEVSPLKTYFEYEQVDVTNAVDVDMVSPNFDFNFFVRQPRLNYEPFDVKLALDVETAGEYTFRFFLGPKVLNRYNLNEVREYFFELDHFLTTLTTGKNTVVRKSREFLYFFRDLIKMSQVGDVEGGLYDYDTINKYFVEYGFPARLMLPKGKIGGLPFTFFVIVHKNDDKQMLGFPFDRKIDVLNFFVPNMYFKDVLIFQDVEYDINSPAPINNIYYNDEIPMTSVRVPLNVDYYQNNELDRYFWHFNDVYYTWYKKYFPQYFAPGFFKKSFTFEKQYPQYPVYNKEFGYEKTTPFFGKKFSYEKFYPTYKKQTPFMYKKDYPTGYGQDFPMFYQKDFPTTYKSKYSTFEKYPNTYKTQYPTVYDKEYPTYYEREYKTKYPTSYKTEYPTYYDKEYPTYYEKEYKTKYPFVKTDKTYYPFNKDYTYEKESKIIKDMPYVTKDMEYEQTKPFKYGRFDFVQRVKDYITPVKSYEPVETPIEY